MVSDLSWFEMGMILALMLLAAREETRNRKNEMERKILNHRIDMLKMRVKSLSEVTDFNGGDMNDW